MAGALIIFLRRHAPFRRGNLKFVIRALNYYAPVGLAEPFEIEAVGHVLRWLLLRIDHSQGFIQRHVKEADFPRCGDIADAAALHQMQGIETWMPNALLWIGERKETTGQIGPGIAVEFEYHGFVASFHPNPTAHNPLHAI